jgi:hypothetical protein
MKHKIDVDAILAGAVRSSRRPLIGRATMSRRRIDLDYAMANLRPGPDGNPLKAVDFAAMMYGEVYGQSRG